MANPKYFDNEDVDPVGALHQQIAALHKRASDLERELRNQFSMPPIPRIDPTTYPNPYEGMRAIDVVDEQHTWYSNGEWRKAASMGIALWEIKVFEDPNIVVVGDGEFHWPVPIDLDGAEIVYADAGVSTPSSSGPVEIQIAHQTAGAGAFTDILTTKISIAAGDKGATPGVVSGGAWGPLASVGTAKDWLRIDVDSAGVDAKGLTLMIGVVPSPVGSVAVQGAQGPPGGVTQWTGAWNSATTYTTGQAVSNGGTSYVAIQGSTNVEPGVTAGWESYWMVLSERQDTTQIIMIYDGNGSPLDVGQKLRYPVKFPCVIEEMTLLADVSGSIVIDLWKDNYGAYPPTSGDSICGSNKPTLSSAIKTEDTTLTGWTTSLAVDDVIIANIDSISVITNVSITLTLRRT